MNSETRPIGIEVVNPYNKLIDPKEVDGIPAELPSIELSLDPNDLSFNGLKKRGREPANVSDLHNTRKFSKDGGKH